MSVSLTALFAVTLHQVKAADADPDSMAEAVMLLARAANNRPVSFEVVDGKLYINEIPIPADAPGTAYVVKVLADHGMARLSLPAGVEPRRWREIAEVLASVAGLYPTPDDIRDALRASVPAAVVVSTRHESGVTDLREELFEIPGLMTDAGAITLPPAEGLTSSSTGRSELSARLDPILKEAVDAVDVRDFERVASLLLEIAAIGEHSDEATRAILARERRRVTPQSFVEAMVRLMPRPGSSPLIARAVMTLGRDGVEALIDAMSGSSNPEERRVYMDALTASADADEAILASLGSAHAELVRDAAEVAGRRRMEIAISALGHLLKHNDEAVRTTAWQALEYIGTNEALAVLYGDHGPGRSRQPQ
jgi:hypothetical protein